MKTSAAGEGCPRSAATHGRTRAWDPTAERLEMCAAQIVSTHVDPAAAARPERPRKPPRQ